MIVNYRRLLVAGLVMAALALLAPHAPAQDRDLRAVDQSNSELANRVSRSVVAVLPVGTALGDWFSVAGGSGFVIDEHGHILTALVNVGRSSSRVNVLLPGQQMVRARVIARDERNACALLKAESDLDVPPLAFGDSERIEVGSTAFTFGNPFSTLVNDDQVAASKGAISGRYRPIDNESGRTREQRLGLYNGPVLESTCAINDGSWGGPLTDRHGRVIGMVCRLVSYRRWVGTAVPIHQIRLGIDRMIQGRELPTAFAGLDADDSPGLTGVVAVTAVAANGPADHAGLRAGDLIVRADGAAIDGGATAWQELITAMPAGARLVLTVKSGEVTRLVPLTLSGR